VKFWIIQHTHRFGNSCWPVFTDQEPDVVWLLENDKDFADDWEGEDPRDDTKDFRDDEYIEVFGPFFPPQNV